MAGLLFDDGTSISSDSRYETRELGLFLLFDNQRDLFTRAEVYNLRRTHEFSGYQVFWAGRAGNEESLNYLKSFVESPSPELNRLADRATFAIALHDDARVETILTDLIRRQSQNQFVREPSTGWGSRPRASQRTPLWLRLCANSEEWSGSPATGDVCAGYEPRGGDPVAPSISSIRDFARLENGAR